MALSSAIPAALGRHRAAPVALALAALLEVAQPARGATGPEHRTPEGSVGLVSAWSTAPAGGDARLGVRFDLAPGWHVYWRNPGDAGYPPALAFAPGTPLRDAALRYPAPGRYELPGNLETFGYAGRMIYPVDGRLDPAAGAGGSVAPLRAQLDYLVCADACIPYSVELALDLPVGEPAEDPATAPELEAWRARLPRPARELAGVDAVLERAGEGALELRLTLRGEGVRATAPELFLDTHPAVEPERARFVAGAAGPGFAVRLRPLDATRPLPERLELAWTATGFETAGRAVAWEGVATVAPPAARRMSPGLLGTALAIALVLIGLGVRRTSRARNRPTAPPEASR